MSYNENNPYQRLRRLRANGNWWVFVLQNPSDDMIPKNLKDVELVAWQVEQGTLNGRHHIQGVVKFLYPKSFSQVRRMMDRAWWHIMLGTWQEAVAYCSKERTRVRGPYFHVAHSSELADALMHLDSIKRAIERAGGSVEGVSPSTARVSPQDSIAQKSGVLGQQPPTNE